MPIYGYRCQSCQREFETQQRMSDPPQADCPVCGGTGTRLFYPTGIHFKGSGFYKTDSRSTPAAATSATDSKPAADGAAKPASDGASKPASPSTESPTPAPAPKAAGSSKPAPSAKTE
ncbi:MAG TPA: FmdB family zinc ribbon protein [Candidatus Deferrimicrobium sp.]|nr:FmdB family zinc ribbon protein [Candidatus Deferrimicrobium sp.]